MGFPAAKSPKLYLRLAECYRRMHRFEEARAALNKTIKVTRQYPEGLNEAHGRAAEAKLALCDASSTPAVPLQAHINALQCPPPKALKKTGAAPVIGSAAINSPPKVRLQKTDSGWGLVAAVDIKPGINKNTFFKRVSVW